MNIITITRYMLIYILGEKFAQLAHTNQTMLTKLGLCLPLCNLSGSVLRSLSHLSTYLVCNVIHIYRTLRHLCISLPMTLKRRDVELLMQIIINGNSGLAAFNSYEYARRWMTGEPKPLNQHLLSPVI